MYLFNRITVNPQLPKRIEKLSEIANNLWWSWNTEFLRLFQRIDGDLWEESNKNPVKFLKHVSQERLEAVTKDIGFLKEYDKVVLNFDGYMNSKNTWFSKKYPEEKNDLIAYFSAEYGIDETIPIYSGGLGILSGDHLKSASDLGIPLVAVGLLYKNGYFHQKINGYGDQETEYNNIELSDLPINLVKDENGEPIIGANIQVVGKSAGTITDMNGRFSISASANSTLQITYIGYQTQTVNIGEQRNINIILQEDNAQLDEVVVVGYGTMKKKDLTGSVTAVKGDELAARRTTQLSTALQGALSGVMVSRDNGAPGSSASIQIRGVTTIGDSSPLVIIDGIPGDINSVNPEDVESMSVLKDAASASIYGSRAAAGVIVITTKRAKSGDVALSYNFEYGWEIPTKLPTYVGAQRYMEMVNETRYNDNPDGGWYQTYTEDEITNWSINNATNPDKYPMTDWGDILLKSSAPRQTHTLSIVGGGKIIRTKASFRYDKTDGLYVNKEYDRFMVRVNNDFNINKYISANLDLNFSRSKALSPNSNPMGAGGRNIPPIYAATWTNGLWGDVKDGENMLAKITDGGTFTNWVLT